MKRGVVLGIFVILVFTFLNVDFTSAEYVCSLGDEFSKSTRELQSGQIKSIQGLAVGLARADASDAISRLQIDLFLDTFTIILTNDTPSASVLFSTGENKSVTVTNLTEDFATITVAGTSTNIDRGEILTVAGVEIRLVEATGTYPGISNLKFILGRQNVFLSNLNNPEEVIMFDGIKYLFELSSGSDENAVIKVGKCANNQSDIINVGDIVVVTANSSDNVSVSGNDSQSVNVTTNTSEDSNDVSLNSSINKSELNGTEQNASGGVFDEDTPQSKLLRIVSISGLILIAFVGIFLLIRYLKSKHDDTKLMGIPILDKPEEPPGQKINVSLNRTD